MAARSPTGGVVARLEGANRELSERLATQQAVNAKLERRCEVASNDAAAHLRSLVELEEESRGFDAAHANLVGSSGQQARQLRELAEERDRAVAAAAAEEERRERAERQLKAADAGAEELRRATEATEDELRGQLAELRRKQSGETRAAEALAERSAELVGRTAELESTRSRLSEADALTRRAEQRCEDLERDLNHARQDAARTADASAADVARVRDSLARAEGTADDVAAESRREMARRTAEVESLESELSLLREAKDAAVREATTARTSSEAAAGETAAALRVKLAAVEETRADGAAQLDAQIRLHEQELGSREEEWAEERQILVRARDAAAAGREHVKTQERLVRFLHYKSRFLAFFTLKVTIYCVSYTETTIS